MVQPVMRSASSRLSNLNAREKKMLVGGTIVALLLLAFLLWPSGEADQSNVELVPADQRGGAASPAPGVTPPPPVTPLPVTPVPAVPTPPVAAASAVPEGLRLFGVTGRGAIIGSTEGGQRYVAVGREVAPGLRLQSVSLHHAVLASPTNAYRLGFNGSATALAPPTAAPAPAPPGQAAITNPAEAQRLAAERGQTSQLQQVLSPRQVNGRTSGYMIRPGINVPALQRAGLQPGDTIMAVNGTPLGPEQLQELAWTINNSTRTQFVVERAGRRIELTLKPGR